MYVNYRVPDSYDQWKKAQHSIFPTIIDTKILATNVQEKLYAHGVTDFSLQTLGNYFDSYAIIFFISFVHILQSYMNCLLFSVHHAAKYFLLILQLLMGAIILAEFLMFHVCRCSIPMETAWPIRKLLCVCRSRIVNRVPIPLIDTQYCYLAGEDPIGQRPDIIVVQPRRHLMWLNRITENKKLHAWAESLTYLIGNYPEFSAEDCDRIKEDLFRVLGSFRIDIKRHHGGSMHIATNTANTYARVCSFFSAHDDYWLMDESGREKKTFEQRIFSFREKKDAEDACGLHVTGTIGVVLAVSFSVIFGIRLVSKYHSF
uniref:AcidPPc domain-containing protein n=1 Tax=Heterorhabditis bacteriophora TaxID=37862 RepID=A0A1I7XF35_HETBA